MNQAIKYAFCLIFFFAQFKGVVFPQQKKTLADAGDIHHIWKERYYAYLNGEKAIFFSSGMPYSKIVSVDIDDDGDQDLFVGSGDGTVAYVENIGTKLSADMELKNRRVGYQDFDDQIKPIDLSHRISPDFLDYDNDGDLDLFVVDHKSVIRVYENIGDRKNFFFRIRHEKYLKIKFADVVSITFTDLNGDSLKDLAYGTKDGTLAYIPNSGRPGHPDFTGRSLLLLRPPNSKHISPVFEDWDKDGKKDVFIGSLTGELTFYQNVGTKTEPKFSSGALFEYESDIYGYSAPVFTDLNGDGNNDLLVGNITNKIRYYESRNDKNGNRSIWTISNNFLRFHSPINDGKRSSVIVKDVNGDGIPDLLAGEKNGNFNLYINQNTKKNIPNYFQISYNAVPALRMKYGVPDLGDLNGDGFPDMLTCFDNGQLVYLVHNQSTREPKWEISSFNFYDLSGNIACTPKMIDFDRDGDLDLFLARADGRMDYYENIGNASLAKLIEADFPYGINQFDVFSVPAFIDWRENGVMSMLIGDGSGVLKIVKDPLKKEYAQILKTLGKADTIDISRYTKHTPETLLYMPPLTADGLILPYVSDYNDDGRPDILYGTEKGNVTLLLNDGYEIFKHPKKDKPTKITPVDPLFDRGKILLKTPFRRVAVAVGDIDGDKDMDIVVGTKKGDIFWIQNTGNYFEPVFSNASIFKLTETTIKHAAPALYDMDADGDLDLLVGGKNGTLHLFENVGDKTTFTFSRINGVFKDIRLSKNASPAVYKFSENELTVIAGDVFGRLNLIGGRKTSDNVWQFELRNRISLNTDVGIGSSPFIGDMNIDGVPELVIGSDSGNMTVLKSTGPFLSEKFSMKNNYLPAITFPMGTFPALVDFDSDQDMDMIVGTDNGHILYFNNTAIQ